MARKRCFSVLVTVVALLACFWPVTEVTASGLATSFSAGGFGEDHNSAQTHRRLRSNVWTTMEEEDNSSEERGLDSIPGAAKILEKLTPDKQTAESKLFTQLKLHEPTLDLFDNPNFHKWVNSVTMSYKRTPDAANAVIVSTIAARHGDEFLARMLAWAKAAPTKQRFATQLEEAQLANWLASKKTAGDVFKLLKLDDEGAKLFKNPVFDTWVSYATKLDDKNPDALIFSVLKARYEEDVLANIFTVAKETHSSQKIAERMENILFAKWAGDGKTADDAFKLLNLNPKADDFLKSPALRSWVSYAKMLEEDPYKLLLATLSARYTDEGLMRMLVMAKQDTKTRIIASTLEEAQFNRWLSQGENAESIFKLFNLDKEGNKLFESPMFRAWESFVKKLDKTNPDKMMLSVLKTSYNDEKLENMLIYAQKVPRTKRFAARTLEDLWISQDKTADDIFKLLKLDQQGKNLFDRGELSTWVSYVTKLNKLDEKPDEFAVINELQKRFGNLELAKMFSAALKNSGPNNDLISSLQTLQFKRWLADGTTPNSLNTMLSKTPILGGFDFRSVDVHLRYLDFYRANT